MLEAAQSNIIARGAEGVVPAIEDAPGAQAEPEQVPEWKRRFHDRVAALLAAQGPSMLLAKLGEIEGRKLREELPAGVKFIDAMRGSQKFVITGSGGADMVCLVSKMPSSENAQDPSDAVPRAAEDLEASYVFSNSELEVT